MMQEEQIWYRYRTGDAEALSEIAEMHYRSLLRYGMKFGLDESEIEDCIQDLFFHLWDRKDKIGPTLSVKNYLLKSLRNRIFDHYRQNPPRKSEEDLAWQTNFSDFHTIEAEWIERESLDMISRQIQLQLDQLPKREKEALYLRYYENLSLPEIADVMGINRQSVANFIQKALRKLRARWAVPALLLSGLLYFLTHFRV